MSPFKRTQRATSKERAGRGRHAKAATQPRSSAPLIEVPMELGPSDYGFPTVPLPASRPIVSAAELRQALDDEPTQLLSGELLARIAAPDFEPTPLGVDDTQPLLMVGTVVDEQPQPAHADGLEPAAAPVIPVPSAPVQVAGLESVILGRPVSQQAPLTAARHRKTDGVRHTFDDGFWQGLRQHIDRAHAVADTLADGNDKAQAALSDRLRRLEWTHMDAANRHNAPRLPRRVPGAALAAIEAGHAPLAVAR